jgi:hypothetical protein
MNAVPRVSGGDSLRLADVELLITFSALSSHSPLHRDGSASTPLGLAKPSRLCSRRAY